MPIVDLQVHTVATPHHAAWQPDALAAEAARIGLRAVAATDHNTTGSVAALLVAGQQHGVGVVPGVEIDSGFGGKLWHTLVYGAPPDAPALLALCAAVFERNAADAEQLRERLRAEGFALPGLDALGRQLNVADVGSALARNNHLPGRVAGEDDESAGMRYILQQGGYNPVGVDEIIAVAHGCGGVAVLAHPGRSKGIYAIPATADDIAAMAAAGLDGIEVYYPAHTPEQCTFYRELAQRHRLLITGGSDSHGPQQPLAQWPADDMLPFLERMGV